MFRESTASAGPSKRTFSTIDPSTENQRGVLSGGELGITLNNEVAGKSVAGLGEDGVIDLVYRRQQSPSFDWQFWYGTGLQRHNCK